MRKICVTELLSPNRVKSFMVVSDEEVSSLIEFLSSSNGRPVNFSKIAGSLANAVISRAVFGTKCNRQEELDSSLTSLFTLSSGFDLPDCFPSLKLLSSVTGLKGKVKRIRQKLFLIIDEMISDHDIKAISDTHREDLVDVLLKLQKSSDLKFPITINHVRSVVLEMLAAGSETTATTLEWAMSELLRNPKVMERAQAEVRQVLKGKARVKEADIEKLNYLKCIVKETLRLHCPAPLVGRESRERCEILGYEVPSKTLLIINAWAIGRDPEVWSGNADHFWPERFEDSLVDFKGTSFEFLPFGAGRRVCPGIWFALANVDLALARLLYHFDWKLPNEARAEELDMSEGFGATCRRKNELYLVATPR